MYTIVPWRDEQPLEDAAAPGRAVQVLGVAEVDYAATPRALGYIPIGLNNDTNRAQKVLNSNILEEFQTCTEY